MSVHDDREDRIAARVAEKLNSDRLADQLSARVSSELAAKVSDIINAKLDAVNEKQMVHNQKIDFLVTAFAEDRAHREKACDEHRHWTMKIQDTLTAHSAFVRLHEDADVLKLVQEHEKIKQRVIGAAKVVAVAGAASSVVLTKWEKVKAFFGF